VASDAASRQHPNVRAPAFVVISLIQPVIWLFLFGQLFRKVIDIPGFGGGSYLDYLIPGIVAMNAVFLLPLTFLSSAFMAPACRAGCGRSRPATRSTGRCRRAVPR
jgi:ABC-type multidrug transport system permease subunit